jgi:uncharacterized Zn finger protein (UPF0148 family)
VSRDDTRFARKECLKCGEPLIRVDGIPCCSECWEKAGTTKSMRWLNKGNYVKIIPNRNV